MSNEKYCPNCQTECNVETKECPKCGYHFVEVKEVDEMASTNTKVFIDPLPAWLWPLISFFCPIAGLIFYLKWKEKWPERSKASGRMALIVSIVITVLIIIVILLAIGKRTGDVV